MADRKPNGEFLGGGPRFNSVGASNRQDPAEAALPPARAASPTRWIVLVLVLLLLAVAIYLSGGGWGVTHVGGRHGGVSADKPTPGRSF